MAWSMTLPGAKSGTLASLANLFNGGCYFLSRRIMSLYQASYAAFIYSADHSASFCVNPSAVASINCQDAESSIGDKSAFVPWGGWEVCKTGGDDVSGTSVL